MASSDGAASAAAAAWAAALAAGGDVAWLCQVGGNLRHRLELLGVEYADEGYLNDAQRRLRQVAAEQSVFWKDDIGEKGYERPLWAGGACVYLTLAHAAAIRGVVEAQGLLLQSKHVLVSGDLLQTVKDAFDSAPLGPDREAFQRRRAGAVQRWTEVPMPPAEGGLEDAFSATSESSGGRRGGGVRDPDEFEPWLVELPSNAVALSELRQVPTELMELLTAPKSLQELSWKTETGVWDKLWHFVCQENDWMELRDSHSDAGPCPYCRDCEKWAEVSHLLSRGCRGKHEHRWGPLIKCVLTKEEKSSAAHQRRRATSAAFSALDDARGWQGLAPPPRQCPRRGCPFSAPADPATHTSPTHCCRRCQARDEAERRGGPPPQADPATGRPWRKPHGPCCTGRFPCAAASAREGPRCAAAAPPGAAPPAERRALPLQRLPPPSTVVTTSSQNPYWREAEPEQSSLTDGTGSLVAAQAQGAAAARAPAAPAEAEPEQEPEQSPPAHGGAPPDAEQQEGAMAARAPVAPAPAPAAVAHEAEAKATASKLLAELLTVPAAPGAAPGAAAPPLAAPAAAATLAEEAVAAAVPPGGAAPSGGGPQPSAAADAEAAPPGPDAPPLVTAVRRCGAPDPAVCVCCACDGKSELLSKAFELCAQLAGGGRTMDMAASQDEHLRRQLTELGGPWCKEGLWYKVDAFVREDGSCVWAVGVGRNKQQYCRAWRLAVALASAAGGVCWRAEWPSPPPGFEKLVEQARAALAAARLADEGPGGRLEARLAALEAELAVEKERNALLTDMLGRHAGTGAADASAAAAAEPPRLGLRVREAGAERQTYRQVAVAWAGARPAFADVEGAVCRKFGRARGPDGREMGPRRLVALVRASDALEVADDEDASLLRDGDELEASFVAREA